ncbi:MAG: hypothetical protein EAZ97_11865, partial [Bacteroidetes bacterium]
MNDLSVKYVELMPTNLAERLLLPENIACQAEISDYLAMTEICQYRIEYHQGYIISWGTYLYDFMKNHELIIPVLIYLLLDYIEKNELSWKITSS